MNDGDFFFLLFFEKAPQNLPTGMFFTVGNYKYFGNSRRLIRNKKIESTERRKTSFPKE